MFCRRSVMGVAAILIHRNNRFVIASGEVLATERFHDPLLNLVLSCAAVAHASTDFLKGCGCNGVDLVTSTEMSADLFFAQSGFEIGDQVTRADDLMSEAANQLYGACIHRPNVKNDIIGGILHSDTSRRRKHRSQAVRQFLPA